jgi:predicted phage tail component-like protein
MFDIIYNGHTAREIGVAITTRPSIPAPQKRGEWVEIGGRSGSVLVTDETYENIEISVAMNFIQPRDRINQQFRRVKDWIQSPGDYTKGSMELRFSDDRGFFYKVKQAGVTDFSRRTKRGADLVATFICDPYTYLDEGLNEVPIASLEKNPGVKSCPIYHITGGNNTAGVLTVNSLTFNFTGKSAGVYLDTENGRAYTTIGTKLDNTVSGDYENIKLRPGSNTIAVSGGAFTATVIPNWRLL